MTAALPVAACKKDADPVNSTGTHVSADDQANAGQDSTEETINSPEMSPGRVELGQILGLDGCYCEREDFVNDHFVWYFYDQNGVEIARQFGFDVPDKPLYFLRDLDGDGNVEMICNCTYGGDGCKRVFIYRNNNGVIEIGSLDEDQVASALGFDSGLGGELAHDEYYDEEKGELVLYSCTEGRNYKITADDFVYQDYSGFGF